MTLKILLFGPQAMLANRQEIELDLSDHAQSKTDLTAGEVLDRIRKAVPELSASLASSRLAIDHEFAESDQIVPADAELALIGMVSGG